MLTTNSCFRKSRQWIFNKMSCFIELRHCMAKDNSYTEAKQNALAEILGIKLSKNSVEKNQDVLEKAVFRVVHNLARLEKN